MIAKLSKKFNANLPGSGLESISESIDFVEFQDLDKLTKMWNGRTYHLVII